MRAVEMALGVICIHFAIAIVFIGSGVFNHAFSYDSELYNFDTPDEMSALNEWEQITSSVSIFNEVIVKIAFWGWITDFVEPYYSQDAGFKILIDLITTGLRILSSVVIGAGVLEFWRNRTEVLGRR